MCKNCRTNKQILHDMPRLEPRLKDDCRRMERYMERGKPYMIGEELYVASGQWAYARGKGRQFNVYLGHVTKVMPQAFEDFLKEKEREEQKR